MCINAPTSLGSFIIGETSGLLLINTGDKPRQMIGLFVMFFSLVQLFEYNIYKNNNIKLNSKLLLLNLATQGFEPRTSGLWAQHANRCAMLLMEIINPNQYLKNSLGKFVKVKLKWGMLYYGILQTFDSYMNLSLNEKKNSQSLWFFGKLIISLFVIFFSQI